MNAHIEFPIGTVVQYNGGDEVAGEQLLVVGRTYTVTDHDFLFGQRVAGFDTGIDGFYAISVDEDGFIPQNYMYFTKVGE